VNGGGGATLDELADNPSRAGALPAEVVTALLARCAVVQSALVGRLLAGPLASTGNGDSIGEDRLLDAGEAAQRLGTSTDYLYRHSRTLPFTVRLGSRLRFSARGIERFIRARQAR
jgi:predicted DNA-binding transcriptional regulator AlpA